MLEFHDAFSSQHDLFLIPTIIFVVLMMRQGLFYFLAWLSLVVGTASCISQAANETGIAEATFQIEGMACQMGCAQAIEDKLNSTAGILEAKVIFKDNKCNLSYNTAELSKSQVVEMVESMGGGDKYKVSDFKPISSHQSEGSGREEEPTSDKENEVQVIFKPIQFPNVFDAFLRLN